MPEIIHRDSPQKDVISGENYFFTAFLTKIHRQISTRVIKNANISQNDHKIAHQLP